jgi:hypothetical protein
LFLTDYTYQRVVSLLVVIEGRFALSLPQIKIAQLVVCGRDALSILRGSEEGKSCFELAQRLVGFALFEESPSCNAVDA